MDSIGKKIKVVEAVRDAVGLTNVSVQHGRAEEIKNRKFDTVVSRAVAPLKELWAWSRPLLRRGPARSSAPAFPSSPPPGSPPEPATSPGSPLPPSGLPIAHGLICLKGGDLAAEIADSRCRPHIMDIHELFVLDYFQEKFLLYIPMS